MTVNNRPLGSVVTGMRTTVRPRTSSQTMQPATSHRPDSPATYAIAGRVRRIGLGAAGAVLLVVAMVLASCSSPAATSSTSSSKASGPNAAATGPSTAVIASATKSSVGTILVDDNGRSLYHLTTDTSTTSTCTGSCASLWPPVTVAAGMKPSAAAGLSGSVGTLTRSDGSRQVTYNGKPLYTYGPDTTTADALGQGVEGVWFVVKAPGAASSAGSTTTSTTARSGGYGY